MTFIEVMVYTLIRQLKGGMAMQQVIELMKKRISELKKEDIVVEKTTVNATCSGRADGSWR